MSVSTEKSSEELALNYEHFVNDNGNNDVCASEFRGCLSDDDSFKNGVHIGIVCGHFHSAMKYKIDHLPSDGAKRKILKEIIDDLMVDEYVDAAGVYEKIVKALNILEDNSLIDY